MTGPVGPGDPTPIRVTVLIPTYNGGRQLVEVLDAVRAQRTDFPFEVICVDSGSRDGTAERLRARSEVRLIEILHSSFDHGATRDFGIAQARGEIVALLSQDARPYDENWLQATVAPFRDPDVVGVTCHQLPREDCNPFMRDRMGAVVPASGPVVHRRLTDKSWQELTPQQRFALAYFDNSAGAVRKNIMRELPFGPCRFGEDDVWGCRAIQAGYVLASAPAAKVVHSHHRSIWHEFRHVYLNHQTLHELMGLSTVPRWIDVLRCSTAYMRHLGHVVFRDERSLLYRLWWLSKVPAFAFTQNLAQYLGRRSVRWRRRWWWGPADRRLARGL